MKSLHITDLAVAADLDHASMAVIQGGSGKAMLSQHAGSMPYMPGNALSFDASQVLGQSQNTTVNNGNNAAFVCGITSNVNPTQHGSNNIRFG
ncbi:MAG TPA: hypothetical protein VIM12_17715 [Noviherbaspirillum sp.]|jgi:hypothetical protein|uniref:hypothetical protein n=1 Tax=Noviherbaspirillum sp. TaxID=1926288 RepID=UPI002F94ECE3